MWINNINPVLLQLGPLQIRPYGIVYVLGFFFGIWWLHYLRRKDKINISKEQIWDFAFYLMLGVLIGSRLGLLFWYPQTYLFHPLNLFKFWEGGMSFHGGFLGVVLAGWLYCRKFKINFWKMADLMSFPTLLFLAIGRVANFLNGELVGRVWNGKGCVVFPSYDNLCRHPSTLYAFGKRLLISFYLLWLIFWQEFKPGFIFWNFVFFEGLGRILVDFFREDTLYFGFSIGQWLSLVMVIVAVFVFLKYYKEDWVKILKINKKQKE